MFSKDSISFDSEDISFVLENQDVFFDWVHNAIVNEGKIVGEISYIFCSDAYLLKINVDHLQHDTFTDIITFNYCEDNLISSDIFISIDRVLENSKLFNTSFHNELRRVMIHGVLHLVGYDDKTDDEKVLMRSREDFYINLR